MTTNTKIFSISGNTDVGFCCSCDLVNPNGKLEHILQYCLYLCQNSTCNHYVCEKHQQPCGFCEGCCAEMHGLGSHQK